MAVGCRTTGARSSRCPPTAPRGWRKPSTGSTTRARASSRSIPTSSKNPRSNGSRGCSPTTRTPGPSSRSTTRCSPPHAGATIRRSAGCGSRCSTSTRSTWCCKGTITRTPALANNGPRTWPAAPRRKAPREARSTWSRSAVRRCTTSSVSPPCAAPPKIPSSTRSSRSRATRCATRPARQPAGCTTPSGSRSARTDQRVGRRHPRYARAPPRRS